MSSCIGDVVAESEARIVVDLHHTGRLDTNDVHYKLIRNASFAPSAISTMLALAATREELAATQVGSSSTMSKAHLTSLRLRAPPRQKCNGMNHKGRRCGGESSQSINGSDEIGGGEGNADGRGWRRW